MRAAMQVLYAIVHGGFGASFGRAAHMLKEFAAQASLLGHNAPIVVAKMLARIAQSMTTAVLERLTCSSSSKPFWTKQEHDEIFASLTEILRVVAGDDDVFFSCWRYEMLHLKQGLVTAFFRVQSDFSALNESPGKASLCTACGRS